MTNTAEVMNIEQPVKLVEFDEFEAKLKEYKAQYEGVVYDLTDPKQDKRARSDRLSIGKTVAELDRRHKAAKAPLKEKVDLLDGERKRIKDGLLEIQGAIKSQIEKHEAELQAIEDALAARVEEIKALSEFEFHPTSQQIQERLDTLSSTAIDGSFANHEANAALAHRKSMESLTALLESTLKAEADAAELARLKKEAEDREQAEREARIAAEAKAAAEREAAEAIEREKQAKIKAEEDAAAAKAKAEQDAKDAAARAEREKAEAIAKAQAEAKAEAERIERERLASIEAERKEAERREANKKHCAKINNEAAAALVAECGVTQEQAKAAIVAIAKKLIPAVSISY